MDFAPLRTFHGYHSGARQAQASAPLGWLLTRRWTLTSPSRPHGGIGDFPNTAIRRAWYDSHTET
jgi:hypothetical protein